MAPFALADCEPAGLDKPVCALPSTSVAPASRSSQLPSLPCALFAPLSRERVMLSALDSEEPKDVRLLLGESVDQPAIAPSNQQMHRLKYLERSSQGGHYRELAPLIRDARPSSG
jgi:hypothetical protein